MMEDWAERKPSIVFECENIRKTFEEMRGRGVQFTQEPKEMPWGLFAIFVDGEGNWYGLRGPANTYEAPGCQGQKTPLTKKFSPQKRRRTRE